MANVDCNTTGLICTIKRTNNGLYTAMINERIVAENLLFKISAKRAIKKHLFKNMSIQEVWQYKLG